MVMERVLFLFARTPFIDLSNLLYFICMSFGIFFIGSMGDRLMFSGCTEMENLQPMLISCKYFLYLVWHRFVNVFDMSVFDAVDNHTKA